VNNLQIYVDYAQPVVKTINEHHNQFYTLWYYNLSPEDLFVDDCLVEFMTQDKNRPEHFNGNMPMVYAQWGEETGASMVLEISPENRKLLSPEVIKVLSGKYHREHGQVGEDWENCADETVYVLMDHQYFQTCAGFEPADDYSYISSNTVDHALDFLSRRLGINYLNIDEARTDLEWKLQPSRIV
jgi:hypothetical protein